MGEAVQRKLAAILSADVAGYSRLMERDEETTLATLKSSRFVIDGLVDGHGGRVFNSAGDSVVAEFPSPVEAVRCAADIQAGLSRRNEDAAQQMQFRIGVNLGDVIVEETNLYGDGVNVAARLEALADPGGVCISRNVYEMVADKLDLAFDDLGDQAVKNIERPVRAYRVRVDGTRPAHRRRDRRSYRRPVTWAVLLVLAVAAGVGLLPPSGEVPRRVPTVAVTPFDDIGTGGAQFSDGLTQDLIVALAAKTDFRVVSDNGDDAVTAHYRLQGGVRQIDDLLRVTASLVSTEDGIHLWGGRYDRASGDTLSVQQEVADKIVVSLAAELATTEALAGRPRSVLIRALAAVGRVAERTIALTFGIFAGNTASGTSDTAFFQTSSSGAVND